MHPFSFPGENPNFYMLSLKILININIAYENWPYKSVKLSKLNTLLLVFFPSWGKSGETIDTSIYEGYKERRMRVNFFPILSFVGNNDENGVQVAGIIKDDGLLARLVLTIL